LSSFETLILKRVLILSGSLLLREDRGNEGRVSKTILSEIRMSLNSEE
jgi:hypothetical protein